MPDETVVLDTNLFVAAGFNPASESAKVLNAVRQGDLRMVWNEATQREINHILRQIPPLAKLATAESFAALFREEDRYRGETDLTHFDFIPDPDDRKFAALAHAANAILVSQDDHLLQFSAQVGPGVMTPRAFWRHFQQEEPPEEQ